MSHFSIKVSSRIKPCLDDQPCTRFSASSSCISLGGLKKSFSYFDKLFHDDVSNAQVYQDIGEPMLNAVLEGYDSCLLCYGQTGSGKTYTLLGAPDSLTVSALRECSDDKSDNISASGFSAPQAWGVFPRAMLQLVSMAQSDDSIKLSVSVVEVYFDHVFDLLNNRAPVSIGTSKAVTHLPGQAPRVNVKYQPHTQKKNKNKYKVQGAKELPVSSLNEVARIARIIDAVRTAKSTDMNDRSSRSHCLITVKVSQRVGQSRRTSKFLFADLAGSERIKLSGVQGDKKNEACSVNSSLTALGVVIRSLVKRTPYVAYRNSVLTMLLKKAFGGNSRTHVVVNVAQPDAYVDETRCSLEFGSLIKCVRNQGIKKKRVTDIGEEVQNLRRQISKLRKELRTLEQSGCAGGVDPSAPPSTQQLYVENERKYKDAQQDVREITQQVLELRSRGASSSDAQMQRLLTRKSNAEKAVWVQEGIIQRMIHSGLYSTPDRRYTVRKAKLEQLEDRYKACMR